MNAITAAGVAFAITRACNAGSLLECSCEKVDTFNNKIYDMHKSVNFGAVRRDTTKFMSYECGYI